MNIQLLLNVSLCVPLHCCYGWNVWLCPVPNSYVAAVEDAGMQGKNVEVDESLFQDLEDLDSD